MDFYSHRLQLSFFLGCKCENMSVQEQEDAKKSSIRHSQLRQLLHRSPLPIMPWAAKPPHPATEDWRDHIKGSPHSDGMSGMIITLRILPAGTCQIGLIRSGENSLLLGLQNQTVILPRKSSEHREQEFCSNTQQDMVKATIKNKSFSKNKIFKMSLKLKRSSKLVWKQVEQQFFILSFPYKFTALTRRRWCLSISPVLLRVMLRWPQKETLGLRRAFKAFKSTVKWAVYLCQRKRMISQFFHKGKKRYCRGQTCQACHILTIRLWTLPKNKQEVPAKINWFNAYTKQP